MKTGSAGIFLELETEVSLSLVDIFNIFGCLFADGFVWNGFKFVRDQLFANSFGFRGSVVFQILFQCHERVRMAAVDDLFAL